LSLTEGSRKRQMQRKMPEKTRGKGMMRTGQNNLAISRRIGMCRSFQDVERK